MGHDLSYEESFMGKFDAFGKLNNFNITTLGIPLTNHYIKAAFLASI